MSSIVPRALVVQSRKGNQVAMANRKTKLSKYEVIIKRQIEHVATVEIETRTAEEAQQIAENEVDDAGSNYWREGDVISQSAKVKVIRGE
jgi:hypothetical protein